MRLDNKTDDYKATRKNVYMSIGVMHFQENYDYTATNWKSDIVINYSTNQALLHRF